MHKTSPRTIYLEDYKAPDYLIDTVDLCFVLDEEEVSVTSKLSCRIQKSDRENPPLVLAGKDLSPVSVSLDGDRLFSDDYTADDGTLTLFHPPDSFVLEIETRLRPQENTSLEGLYRSSGNFCTQCEAEGFRKITYFLDRPDIMTRYTTTIIGDKEKFPVMLSNGNLVETKMLDDNRHLSRWEDPFAKPSYLFALVAGDLACIKDYFVTASSREVSLEIYVQHHNKEKCGHAMRSLKKAMRWDEEVYGLEYDLDQYMIVAVDDFNMGAMENKGLNVFNSKYVLARQETATDNDYEGIEGVIAHEYFHNWTGNRVTCRDWFQLSLKEGLTVFRDQEFSSDMHSRAVKRIHDVSQLRNFQFPEDSGPMAHPVRPASYIEINNFYTVTVYEKGAEIIRMLQTILGQEAFLKGVALYLEKHDGHAATTDDFINAMEEAGGVDLSQFGRWYSQAGTPRVTVSGVYDREKQRYTLTVKQECPETPGQKEKKPFLVPIEAGLLDSSGNDMELKPVGMAHESGARSVLLTLAEDEEVYSFDDVPEPPVPSLLRTFSAPVILDFDYSDNELAFLLANDSDPFNRWEAGQRLGVRIILRLIDGFRKGGKLLLDDVFLSAFRAVLLNTGVSDKTFMTQLLTLPAEKYLAEQMKVIDVAAIHEARQFVKKRLAGELRDLFLSVYRENIAKGPYRFDAHAAGGRRLKNICLSYLMTLSEDSVHAMCFSQFSEADNMTDTMGALTELAHNENPYRAEALALFSQKWGDNVLVMDKWFAVQATAPLSRTLEEVKRLMGHNAFSIKNPNKVRSLIGAFCSGNPVCFHDETGAGYQFLADNVIELNSLNPQIAARLLGSMSRWRKYDRKRQGLMRTQLERIIQTDGLSKDVYEIASKSLGVT